MRTNCAVSGANPRIDFFSMNSEKALLLLDAMRATPQAGGLASLARSRPGSAAGTVNISTVVDWLAEQYGTGQHQAAEDAAALVLAGGFVTTKDKPYATTETGNSQVYDETRYYRHYGANVARRKGLNVLICSENNQQRDVESVLVDISNDFTCLCDGILARNGHEVLYKDVRKHPAWPKYLLHVSQLANAYPSQDMPDNQRRACFLNLYNSLIIHAKLVYGHPNTVSKRGAFFNNAAYFICGVRLTSIDIEHQVLRCKAGPESPFYALKLSEIDPRMHFVLNCGARSCPPIRPISVDNTESDIRESTLNFIGRHVVVDENARRVCLSRLWKWFRNDFTPGTNRDQALIAWISSRAPNDVHKKLTGLLSKKDTDQGENAEAVKINFLRYDWADNGDWNAPADDRFMFVYDASFARTK